MARTRTLMPALSAPPLAYAGERDALLQEREELLAKLRRNAPGSIYTPGLRRRLNTVTARLLVLGEALPPLTGSNRKDLQ